MPVARPTLSGIGVAGMLDSAPASVFVLASFGDSASVVGRCQCAAFAQPLHLCFQLSDARFALGDRGRDSCRLEALRDMLGAVRIPGRDGEQYHLLGASPIALRHQSCGQLAIAFNDAGSTPYFDALTLGVVDQEQVGLGILSKVARRDVLPIACEIDKAKGFFIEHLEKARRATAMLNVGLTFRIGGGQEDAGLPFDEGPEISADVRRPGALVLALRVAVARTLTVLDRLDGRRKGDIARIGVDLFHRVSPKDRAGLSQDGRQGVARAASGTSDRWP